MSKPPLIIYWSRRDLRLADNPALTEAVALSRDKAVPLLPLFILEDYMRQALPEFQFGYPSRYFLAQALPKFADHFTTFAVVTGKAADYLLTLAELYDLEIFVNDDVYSDFYTQVNKLTSAGIAVTVCPDALTVSKETRSQEGKLYSVFTPFKKSVWVKFVAQKPLPVPELHDLPPVSDIASKLPNAVAVDTTTIWSLFSKSRVLQVGTEQIDLSVHTSVPELTAWYSTEGEAIAWFKEYLQSGDMDAYDRNRNSLELDVVGRGKTSKMSLALAWGLISARQLVTLLQDYFGETFDNPLSGRVSAGALTFISELIWREFYRYQLFHHPQLMATEFQARFRGSISWVKDPEATRRFTAWIRGETGYPVVDAAMKQLSATGWMHNRSRMIVASILTKNLGVDWRWGQEYFRAALIDLDEASNNGGWQWGASVGADPKPIRIFNAELQAKNYDKSGAYQHHWLANDGILFGGRMPLVEHKTARADALVRYGLVKSVTKD